ncbi:hypothetical protein ACGFYV_05490 [Streptomyces sp. NPDC048297]
MEYNASHCKARAGRAPRDVHIELFPGGNGPKADVAALLIAVRGVRAPDD